MGLIKRLIPIMLILLLSGVASALAPAPSATRLTTTGSNEISPALMQDSSGKIWLFYASDATGNNDIYYKTSSDGGATWSAEQPLVADSSSEDGVYGISSVQDSSGKIWVTWAKSTSFGSSFDIYYKTSTDGGNTWSPSIRFTSYGGDDMSPSIFQDDTNKIWIVWRSYGIGWGDDTWAKTSSDGGDTWSSPVAISTDPAREDIPFATADSTGKIWAVWRKEVGANNWNIYMKTSDDNGATWSSASEMTSDSGAEDHPSVIKDSSGKVWLFWDHTPTGNWNDRNIFYKYSLDNGATWSSASQFTSAGSNRDPRMLEDSSGKVWLVWSSNAEGNYDIWSAAISQTTPSQAPIADFIFAPLKPKMGENVAFDASSSYDPDGGSIASYEWDFNGDGYVDATGATTQHVYARAGTYTVTVTLTVTDDEGSKSSKALQIEIYTHRVAYIPAKYKDTQDANLPPISLLKQRADKVIEYYNQQSYGQVKIGYEFVGKGCEDCWTTLNKDFSEFPSPGSDTSKDSYYIRWSDIREYAIDYSGIRNNLDYYVHYDAIVVIQPERMRAFTDKIGGKEIIVYSERDTFATWAHELGHSLFSFGDYYSDLTNPERKTMGNIWYWGLMGEGNVINPPAPIMSYNKLSAGWLKPKLILPVIGYGNYEIKPISRMSSGDGVNIYSTAPIPDLIIIPGLIEFNVPVYIFEGRLPTDDINTDINDTDLYNRLCYRIGKYDQCLDGLVQKEGILLYRTDIFGNVYTIPNKNIEDFVTSQSTVTLLPDENYPDYWAAVIFAAKKENSQLYINIQPFNPLSRKVIYISGIQAEISLFGSSAESLQTNISEDYDLHIYTIEGKHVGMNYSSGKYELSIEGANTSGNLLGGGPEWISIPDNINAYYVLDATPAKEWAKQLNVTVENITVGWQVVYYDSSGIRKESEPITSNINLDKPTDLVISATITIGPNTLNSDSTDKWITSYIELPKGYDASKINTNTVMLNYTLAAENNTKYGFVKSPTIGDRDSNGLPELMVKFSKSNVQKMLQQTKGKVDLTVTGEVMDNNGVSIPFKGAGTIRVI